MTELIKSVCSVADDCEHDALMLVCSLHEVVLKKTYTIVFGML